MDHPRSGRSRPYDNCNADAEYSESSTESGDLVENSKFELGIIGCVQLGVPWWGERQVDVGGFDSFSLNG